MCRFEDKFRLWLDWLQDPGSRCGPDGIHPVCRIVDCIKNLKSEPACTTIPGAGGECDCEKKEEKDIKPFCLPLKTEGSLFWGHCIPEEYDPRPDNGEILLVRLRKRNANYIANMEELADDQLKETKSYERALSFMNKKPSIDDYVELVNFFNRYSLAGNSNEAEYLQLLHNATLHLLDNLVADYEDGIPEEEMKKLEENLKSIFEKGLSEDQLFKDWNSENLASSSKSVSQITEILKG